MTNVHSRCACLVLMGVTLLGLTTPEPLMGAVSRRDIDAIRQKVGLETTDLATVQAFVNEQLDAMVGATTEAALADATRELIEIAWPLVRDEATVQAYRQAYAEAVLRDFARLYQQGLQLAEQQNTAQLGDHLRLSATVVLANTGNPKSLELFAGLLADPSAQVRYWGAKGMAQPELRLYLQSQNAATVRAPLLKGLTEAAAKETSAAVLVQLALAADLPAVPESIPVVQACAARRVAQYNTWLVTDEWADTLLIQRLLGLVRGDVASNDPAVTRALVRNAADLYSAAFDRYSKAMNYAEDNQSIPLLQPASKRAIETLLIQGETEFLVLSAAVTGRSRRPRMQAALPQSNWPLINKSFEALLSPPSGDVVQAFDIYQGNEGPLKLADPPAELIQNAKTLLEIQKKTVGGEL